MFEIFRKKTIRTVLISFILLFLLLAPNLVFGYSFLKDSGAEKTAEGTGHIASTVFVPGELTAGVAAIVYTVLSLVGIVFLLLMMYGGYLWMTAQGNDQQVEKAKRIIVSAILGLAIVIAAYAISWFIVNAFQSGRIRE